ncbi:MAG: 1-acyl-sn-glycerol-3-phosphate acyltransferase [Ruminococcaceae bacterium]|nr:1-acyl-sn-glycerol-3-phosphate acyltransferase [Oscillospiraceae bacterium]
MINALIAYSQGQGSETLRRKRQSRFWYWITRFASWIYSKRVFKCHTLRNEIKGKKGPFVIIANHEAQLDFVNLIGATRRRMRFVVSESFYSSIPVKRIMTRLKVIPKQQFQTTVTDIKRMKEAIDRGKILVIYPAGLNSEDGASTPIPDATYKFLKWIGTDIYVARTTGAYMVAPKWSKIKRPGKTTIDIYKLFDKEEISQLDEHDIRERAREALIFDEYREQEKLLIKRKHASNVEGLENVLYACPFCKSEFTIKTKGNKIWCTECGFAHEADEYGFLHNVGTTPNEIRYVTDWSKMIFEDIKCRLETHPDRALSSEASIHMIDYDKHKFHEIAKGSVTLDKDEIKIGIRCGSTLDDIVVPISHFASLPFRPGKFFEVQKGPDIYRLIPENVAMCAKFVYTVEAFYELNSQIAKRSVH